jgi:hypothetical protein
LFFTSFLFLGAFFFSSLDVEGRCSTTERAPRRAAFLLRENEARTYI